MVLKKYGIVGNWYTRLKKLHSSTIYATIDFPVVYSQLGNNGIFLSFKKGILNGFI